MRKLVLAGLVLGLGGLTAPAAMAGEAGGAAIATSVMAQASAGHVVRNTGNRGYWGRRIDGRWSAGVNAPGGWNGYYRPVRGWSLPSYWINPSYYIGNAGAYGLPVPAAGYGWSRYYDDAVLTDRYGRVSDARYGYDWDRYGGYDDDSYSDDRGGYDERGYDYRDDSDRRERSRNGVVGAVAGGLIGGVAGSAIAGRGDKTTGAILGAGVGAVAGGLIGSSSGRSERNDGRMPYDYGTPDDGRPYPYADGGPVHDAPGYTYNAPRNAYDAPQGGSRAAYDGRWVGTWYGDDGRVYSGTYDGRFNGKAKVKKVKGGYAMAPAPQPLYRPLPAYPLPAYGYGYGYQGGAYAGGYTAGSSYYQESVDVVPALVTTTVTEETVYSTVRKAAARKVVRKARPKPRPCSCSCICQ